MLFAVLLSNIALTGLALTIALLAPIWILLMFFVSDAILLA